ncbi:MAG TPA: CvpA family protein [Kouleothrix sp.]|uniref:CvpA family protein n=1 Tax=Kouleothrix sp. TaxID=2779161 RepID=UPI002B6D868A|nr:CvpA family protein [Kouleothrix sp.]HRC77324.1 CvpA family protein [Kouleothrix sp.]
MNGVDLIFILILLGGLALGFFQGTVKLLVAIVAFYVAIVLASLYFQSVGNFFRLRFNTTADVGQITAFAVVLMVSFLLLTIAGLYTFRYFRMPVSLDFIDKILGTLLGLLMAALFMGMLAVLLKDLFVFRSPASSASLPFMIATQSSVRASTLVRFFGDNILPLIYTSVRPVLPREADIIFRVR